LGILIQLFLAGGLNKDNVRQAIESVEPFGIDICTGVFSNGFLTKTPGQFKIILVKPASKNTTFIVRKQRLSGITDLL
jgi:phosphoribosylanthranilate isomerase